MIKAIIFDIDGTLYDYDTAHAAAFRAVTEYGAQHFGLSAEEFQALHRQGDRMLRSHIGTANATIHNRLLRYQLMLESIGQPITHAPVMAGLYWSTFLGNLNIFPGVRACLETLRQSGYVLGLGTDMTADYQYQKLLGLNLLHFFDFMVCSEEVNAEKPDLKLFRRCAEKAGCTMGECVFIGDNSKKDIAGAVNAGMHPVWFCPTPREEDGMGAVVIRHMSQLPALIQTFDTDSKLHRG